MRFVPIQYVKAGDVIGYDVYDTQGRTVIGAGIALTTYYIERLKESGFPGVYVDDDLSKDVKIQPLISPALRANAMNAVKAGDLDKTLDIAKSIIDEIVKSGTIALDMADIRSFDDYTFAHSTNVAVLACVLGLGMQLPEDELNNLVTAALLHDMGKVLIPKEILNKPSRLTQEEYELVKTHPSKSYELIKERIDISAHVKKAVLMHHENEDGSGYPMGAVNIEIPFIAKMLHVVDVYDALISDRPYKKGYAPWEAAEYLMGACGIMFDRRVVSQFIRLVPLYPKGTEIVLSDGRRAIVLENAGDHNLRPVVRVVDSGVKVDLLEREYSNITIFTGYQWEKEQQAKSEAERQSMIGGRGTRPVIMVVDDMKTNLVMLDQILGKDYEVLSMNSGEEALTYLLRNERPNLVLMDIDMPGMSGIETAERINTLTNGQLPILFVSAICDKDTVIACRKLHAAGYVARPYQAAYILAEIERILRK